MLGNAAITKGGRLSIERHTQFADLRAQMSDGGM
jgi:hypothetical protein